MAKTIFSTTTKFCCCQGIPNNSNYWLNKKYVHTVDINPIKIHGAIGIDYLPVSSIPFDSFSLPVDSITKKQIPGVFKIVGSSPEDKILIPAFYNRLYFKLVFIPEDQTKYLQQESILEIVLENQDLKLSFSGTRGKWFL